MLDAEFHPFIEKSLSGLARKMAAKGFDANMITMLGAGMALPVFAALAMQAYSLALVFLLINRFCDGLDGVVARYQKGGPTDYGAFLDTIVDFVFYAGFVFFFALGRPDVAVPAAFLIFSFTGVAATALAYAVLVEKRNGRTEKADVPGKPKRRAFATPGGLTEGFEIILLFAAMCLLPDAFRPMAIIFGAMCWLTVMTRIAKTRAEFAAKPATTS
ncbi:MAG: CDP-alcohol phosphatidyltransferase family protein [Micavibrio aeruginosavorus]|nr:CDP-alcohol phosphatidyltransferase family protein [Micavibrio aeruginosavorus]